MTDKCKRPGCNNTVDPESSQGIITLNLWRRPYPARLTVEVHQNQICGGCANDLADWWLR